MFSQADVTFFLCIASSRHKNTCAIFFYEHGTVMFAVSQKDSIIDLVIEDWHKQYILKLCLGYKSPLAYTFSLFCKYLQHLSWTSS